MTTETKFEMLYTEFMTLKQQIEVAGRNPIDKTYTTYVGGQFVVDVRSAREFGHFPTIEFTVREK